MKILDKTNITKSFSQLEKGEVFRGNNNIYVKINQCFSIVDIEDSLDCEGPIYNVNDLIDSYNGFNAVNLGNGYLTFFDECTRVTPLNAELHIL
jgi:hypothetical protein